MRSDVALTLRCLPNPELRSGGWREDAVKTVNTVTGLSVEPTGSVVWSSPLPNCSSSRVGRARKATVGPLSSVWQNGSSDGCRAQLRLRGVSPSLATLSPTLSRVFCPKLGKYCSRSPGGLDTQ